MTRRRPSGGVPDRASTPNVRQKRLKGRFYNPEKLTKEGIRSIGAGDSGMWEAAGDNRDVWRQSHRVADLPYVGQIRHSSDSTNGFTALFPPSSAGEIGWVYATTDATVADVQSNVIPFGKCGLRFKSDAGGEHHAVFVNWGHASVLSYTPSSIAFGTVTSVNVSNVLANELTSRGFMLDVTANAAGDVTYTATYEVVP